jgi:hypothetical protein
MWRRPSGIVPRLAGVFGRLGEQRERGTAAVPENGCGYGPQVAIR